MKFVKLTLLLMLPLFLSGCFGLAVGTYGKHQKLTTGFVLAKGKNNFGISSHPEDYSEADITRFWGKPDETTLSGCCKVLKYHDGISWAGVGAFVIVVPIPLLLPSGHYNTSLYLKGGKCVGLVSEYGEVSQIYGFMWADNGGGFVSGDAKNGPRRVPLDFCK
jgi:hypothetical protein